MIPIWVLVQITKNKNYNNWGQLSRIEISHKTDKKTFKYHIAIRISTSLFLETCEIPSPRSFWILKPEHIEHDKTEVKTTK